MKMRLCLAILAGAALASSGQGLDDLAKLPDFSSHRITSSDPAGGNNDWRILNPGETLVLAEIKGPGCIVHLRDNITSEEAHHLQYHVLRMYWDGEKDPSVEAPVGDFFAIGFGFSDTVNSSLVCIDHRPGELTNSAAFGAARNCYFPMPFKRSARITISNEGRAPSKHWYEVDYRTYEKLPAKQGYFHAQYRQGTPPPEGPDRPFLERDRAEWWSGKPVRLV